MSRGFGDRKRRFSELQDSYVDLYVGPEEFVEAGTRGFLLATFPEKEEYGVDDAIELLRQGAVKLHGGIKARKSTDVHSLGYVRIDFMDPKDITLIPNPDGEEEEEDDEEEEKEDESEKKESDEKEGADDAEKESKSKKASGDKGKEEEEASDKEDSEDKDDKESEDKEETGDKDEKEGDEKQSKDDDKKSETSEKKDGKTSQGKDGKEKSKKRKYVFMKTTYKFKAFRTEIRNLMFIKSDYPDPCKLSSTVMEIVKTRKSSGGDAINQLMPVLGVCEFNLFQLEVMCRRVLTPVFDESLPPKNVSIMLFDKLSEPGSLMLMEVIRNTIWSINPLTGISSPLTEPDVTIRLEVICSKLILCCMPDFIKNRQYTPSLLHSMGYGEPEDDDLTHISTQERKEEEERKERKRKQEEERKKREEAKKARREQEAKERHERRAAEDAKREAERKKRAEKKEKEKAEGEGGEKASEGDKESSQTESAAEGAKEENAEEQNESMEVDKSSKGRKRMRKTAQAHETAQQEAASESKDEVSEPMEADTSVDADAENEEDSGKSPRSSSRRSSSRKSKK